MEYAFFGRVDEHSKKQKVLLWYAFQIKEDAVMSLWARKSFLNEMLFLTNSNSFTIPIRFIQVLSKILSLILFFLSNN